MNRAALASDGLLQTLAQTSPDVLIRIVFPSTLIVPSDSDHLALFHGRQFAQGDKPPLFIP
jgi:hypothetical protein